MSKCVGWLSCEQLRRTDKWCLPQPSLLWWLWFDFPVGLLFSPPLPLCLVFLSTVWLLKELAVDCVSFFVFKPQSRSVLHPRNLGSVHVTSLTLPQTHRHLCMQARITKHTGAGAGVHTCWSAEACTSFFNGKVTSHPCGLCTFYSNNFLSHLWQDADKQKHKRNDFKITKLLLGRKPQKLSRWMQISAMNHLRRIVERFKGIQSGSSPRVRWKDWYQPHLLMLESERGGDLLSLA